MALSITDRDIKAFTLEANMNTLWQFNYRRGVSASWTQVCQATTEERALAVARKWCEHNAVRLIGDRVTPFICADESILKREAADPMPAGEVLG